MGFTHHIPACQRYTATCDWFQEVLHCRAGRWRGFYHRNRALPLSLGWIPLVLLHLLWKLFKNINYLSKIILRFQAFKFRYYKILLVVTTFAPSWCTCGITNFNCWWYSELLTKLLVVKKDSLSCWILARRLSAFSFCPQATYMSAIFIHLLCFLVVKFACFMEDKALKEATKKSLLLQTYQQEAYLQELHRLWRTSQSTLFFLPSSFQSVLPSHVLVVFHCYWRCFLAALLLSLPSASGSTSKSHGAHHRIKQKTYPRIAYFPINVKHSVQVNIVTSCNGNTIGRMTPWQEPLRGSCSRSGVETAFAQTMPWRVQSWSITGST